MDIAYLSLYISSDVIYENKMEKPFWFTKNHLKAKTPYGSPIKVFMLVTRECIH